MSPLFSKLQFRFVQNFPALDSFLIVRFGVGTLAVFVMVRVRRAGSETGFLQVAGIARSPTAAADRRAETSSSIWRSVG